MDLKLLENVEIFCFYTEEFLGKHLDVNLKRDLPVATEDMFKNRTATLCGSGPSIAYTIKEFEGDIWACNGAYNYLQDKGIIADYFFGWDAGPEFFGFISRPHKDTTFFIASFCDPKVFDLLKDYKVVMWHSYFDDIVKDKLVENKRMEMITGGGSACMTRAPVLLQNLGYKEIHLHGADSSMTKEASHIHEDGITGDGITEVFCAGRSFKTPGWLLAQAQEFPAVVANLNKTKIIVHGDGLIPHIARMNGMHYHNVI